MTYRLIGLTMWIIQAAWYTNTPNPDSAPIGVMLVWAVLVLGGAGLMFAPRGSR